MANRVQRTWRESRRFCSWLARFMRLVKSWRTLWLAIIITLAAVVFALVLAKWLGTNPEYAVRRIGAGLQFLGLASVALGLLRTRQLFGLPKWREALRSWWDARPRWLGGSGHVVVAGSDSVSINAAEAIGRLSVQPKTGATLEDRVARLERAVGLLHEDVGALRSDLVQRVKQLKQDVKQEGEKRVSGDEQVKHLIESVSIGGIDLEVRGLIWLLVGMLMASLPTEVARLVPW